MKTSEHQPPSIFQRSSRLFSLLRNAPLLQISWQKEHFRLELEDPSKAELDALPYPIESGDTLHEWMDWSQSALLEEAKAYATPFEFLVWHATCTIPFGETLSYQQLATQIGSPQASRAVGNALGKNRFAPFIPCHRIICSDGSLGGYAFGVEVKRLLLLWEKGKSLR